MAKSSSIFKSDRRIRLGIWGLGRGMSFFRTCQALGIDVVAGCDYNQHMRDNFAAANPGAFVTDDAAKFLEGDFDAVLLATFCPAHADDAIRCLEAGKHVLSEVTSFHTVAEGVRLVDAVEKSGKVYNLAENYPFSAANMWLARRWREGLFGELMYGEYEYVHECRTLAYTYIDSKPINPGNQTHSWRSWLNFHYYNTHSLGPVMHITGLRPTRTTALPVTPTLAGYPMASAEGMGGATPSLIQMSNGAVVRNLMGATSSDTHSQRLWGTLGAAQMVGQGLQLRLGAAGHAPMHEVIPHWDELGELAAKTGHGGGDFWILYHFAKQILEGTPAPFDIYTASDCTLQGIQAFRSTTLGGQPVDIPDFRNKAERDKYRDDHFDQKRFDNREGLFPAEQDTALTQQFSLTMRDLIHTTTALRAYRDWQKVMDDMREPSAVLGTLDRVEAALPRLAETTRLAQQMIERYPGSVAARVLGEMLDLCDEPITETQAFAKQLKKDRKALQKKAQKLTKQRAAAAVGVKPDKWASAFVTAWRISKLTKRPKGGIEAVEPAKLGKSKHGWKACAADASGETADMVNVHRKYDTQDGIAYIAQLFDVAKRGTWLLMVGHDAAVKVFVDGKPVFVEPKRQNPAKIDRSAVELRLARGTHEIVIALDTDKGNGWGTYVRWQIPKAARKGMKDIAFPEPAASKPTK